MRRVGVSTFPWQTIFKDDKFALPIAKECGVKVAVETFGNTSKYKTCDFFGRIKNFMRAYNDAKAIPGCGDMMSICIDTVHTRCFTLR